ncbi:MAG: OmpA family protein [Devosiaceae bacterium]|nr:OmpA family protein [Devosiaceae bacterium]
MGSVISKWIFPGIVTVVIGTFATLFFTQSTIEDDLTQKSMTAIVEIAGPNGADWAKITFDARDGNISGLTTNENEAREITDKISAIPGVRSLSSNIEIAPTVSPYPFSAVLNEGIVSLSGGVPSAFVRDALLEQTGAKDAGLDLISGVPDGDWLAATTFAVSQLDGLESGQATLADLSLSVTGLAKSIDSYDEINSALSADLPNGLTLATAAISPAMVENYTFSASKDDNGTTVSGFVPDEATRNKVEEMTGAPTQDLDLASGAPQNFMSSLDFGLKLLGTTSDGEMSYENSELTITGTAASAENFEMAGSLASSAAPEGVELKVFSIDPQIATPYFWFVQKGDDGILSVNGNVPNKTTRAAIMRRAGENAVDRMQIAGGAPETYYADALAGISSLSILDSGRAGYAGSTWYLIGQPASEQAAMDAQSALLGARTNVEQWRVSIADAPPVPVVPYLWSADKFSNGTIILNGNVPDEATKAAILLQAGDSTIDNMEISFGAPDMFSKDTVIAISALESLISGRVGNSADGWFLFGQATDVDAQKNAVIALTDTSIALINWRVEFADIPQAEVEPEPVQEEVRAMENFTFNAKLDASGNVQLFGQVPNQRLATYLGLISGASSVDDLVANEDGAPNNFSTNSRTGIRALRSLDEGELSYGENIWTLSGQSASEEVREKALALIASLVDGDSWKTDISLITATEACNQQIERFLADNSIEFETASARIASDSANTLQELALLVNRCPTARVNVEGHTDNQGDFGSNLKLSSDRADSVVEALIELGVSSDRLFAVGFGQDRPVADNDTEEGRQQNRRIEIKIID